MSAIAGILHFDGAPPTLGQIEKLTAAMNRRGPDTQTHWSQGPVALGHCMLRTTPESFEERQPLFSEDKRLALIWDGRLDNRDELRRALIAEGARLRDNSDPELVLGGYAAWGDELPKHLLGDFAFAVWDAQQKRLFCARDHMGARPFYYTRNERFFAFASEEEALTLLPGVSAQPNEERIAYFLIPGFQDIDFAHSWLEDIWTLMPARILSASPDGALDINCYWTLQPGGEARYASDQECQEAFLDVFGEAVHCRMRSSGNVSAMMSGGLDSAAVAAMVKRILPQMPGKEFHTYSAISDHPDACVETQCIFSLTRDLGANAHFVSVPSFTGMLSVEDLIETAWAQPHPVDNSILLPAMMCLAAARDGQRVLLHGASGDLTTHVATHYAAFLLKDRKWLNAWRECRAASLNNTYLRGSPPALLFTKALWHSHVPRQLKVFTQRVRSHLTHPSGTQTRLNDAFARRLNIDERLRAQRDKVWSATWHSVSEEHLHALQPYAIARGLEGYERVAGRYGVELRDPWADKRVVEFFLGLPVEYRTRNGWTKHLARVSFPNELEHIVRYRLGKEHLGWQFTARVMQPANPPSERTVDEVLARVAAFVDEKSLRPRYEKMFGKANAVDVELLYDTMTLALWLKRLAEPIDNAAPRRQFPHENFGND